MGIFSKIFKKKDEFDLGDDPFSDLHGNSSSDHDAFGSQHSDSLTSHGGSFGNSMTEQTEHGTLTSSKEFSTTPSTPMAAPQYGGQSQTNNNDHDHVQELLQRDMQVINAKLDAIKANVEILSHKIESLEKSTNDKKKNTYW